MKITLRAISICALAGGLWTSSVVGADSKWCTPESQRIGFIARLLDRSSATTPAPPWDQGAFETFRRHVDALDLSELRGKIANFSRASDSSVQSAEEFAALLESYESKLGVDQLGLSMRAAVQILSKNPKKFTWSGALEHRKKVQIEAILKTLQSELRRGVRSETALLEKLYWLSHLETLSAFGKLKSQWIRTGKEWLGARVSAQLMAHGLDRALEEAGYLTTPAMRVAWREFWSRNANLSRMIYAASLNGLIAGLFYWKWNIWVGVASLVTVPYLEAIPYHPVPREVVDAWYREGGAPGLNKLQAWLNSRSASRRVTADLWIKSATRALSVIAKLHFMYFLAGHYRMAINGAALAEEEMLGTPLMESVAGETAHTFSDRDKAQAAIEALVQGRVSAFRTFQDPALETSRYSPSNQKGECFKCSLEAATRKFEDGVKQEEALARAQYKDEQTYIRPLLDQ